MILPGASKRGTLAAIFSVLLVALAFAQSTPQLDSTLPSIPPVQAVRARGGMVVAQEAQAARIGADILKQGGNAVDAAVAVGFALAVTYPRAGNLGGGGFMVIHLSGSNDQVAIDYRETAPAAATRDMFLDDKGEPDQKKSRESALSIGIPGTVAGLTLAHAKYSSGKFSLAALLAPAIKLAREGTAIADDTADSLPIARERMARWPSSLKILQKPDGTPLKEGDRLVQSDLAGTLEKIAQGGPDAFYRGETAQRIAAAVRAAGGIVTEEDLRNYSALVRQPVRGRYRGIDVVSMPPPSSGGVHLIEMLNIIEGYEFRVRTYDTYHRLIEAMKRAYADRAVFLGDPDAVNVPIKGLTSKRYAATLRAGMSEMATPSAELRPGRPRDHEGDNTTHFSVVDRDGNAVANTYTLNFSYGVGLIADGTGVLLNNELDDFTAKPGASNAFGLVGFDANLPAPGKRPLSSMTPTILLKDGKPVLVLGSPGGSRIISAVLQVIVNSVDRRMSIGEAVSTPRLHHQWMPDEVVAEPGLAAELSQALVARGHKLVTRRPATAVNAIAVTPDGMFGAADSRTRGALAAGID